MTGENFHVRRSMQLLDQSPNLTYLLRISIKDALNHPFLRRLHERMDEPECPLTFDNGFENGCEKSMEEIRLLIMEEIKKPKE